MRSAFEISAQGLMAERRRIEVIANNLANANTSRTPEGTPFRRQLVVMLGSRLRADRPNSGGVQVTSIADDPTPFQQVYNPGHPDANADGYVAMPNVNPITETVDMLAAARTYEANVAALNATKRLVGRARSIIEAA